MSKHAMKQVRYQQPGGSPPFSRPDQAGPSQALTPDSVAARAYELWRQRGSPEGSPEEDWFRAEGELRQDTTANRS